MSLAVLLNPQLPQPALLDAIRHSETGHLSDDAARTAVSPKGAVGPYQFMQKFLRDFGYGMPKDIPISDVQDLSKSRQLADKFITGFSDYHQFTTPLEKLVAYNAGPQFAAEWKAQGANIADLPAETQKYIQTAAAFLTQKGNDDMAYLGMPSEDDPNRTIDGQVINPDLAAMQAQRDRIDAAIRNMVAAANYPPSRYMDPRLRQQSPAQVDQDAALTIAMPNRPRPGMTTGFYNPNSVERQVAGGPVATSAATAMAMPSETDATQNIDGSQVAEDAILNQVGQGLTGVFEDIVGPNSRPQNPPALTTGAYSPDAVLQQVMGITPAQAATTGPALTYNSTPQPRSTGIGQVSQNRRDRSIMSMVPPPPQRIGLNEALIRIGGAGVRGSAQGGLEAIGAMTDAYGQIQDANRATGLASYQAQMEALAKGTTAKQQQENMEQVGQIDATLYDMDRALGYLERDGMNLTGFFDSTFGAAWDNIVGNPEASARLLLKKLRVDDTLLRVAQTKGAISNKEMDLFMSPAPSDTQDEQVWIDWIKERQIALRDIRRRLATGEQASNPASSAQIDQFSRQPQQQGGNFADADAIVGIN